MTAKKRKPTKAVMEQFFPETVTKVPGPGTGYVSRDPNCLACGSHVLPHKQADHVDWHLKLTKLFESKRDKL